ncbi:MAG: aminodeoxychorismate synthase component I [Planctomycetes bacterium]|nr:aminodeoxychorismate synthase component I [Planctomycetota bacterium]
MTARHAAQRVDGAGAGAPEVREVAPREPALAGAAPAGGARRGAFWLESSLRDPRWGRYGFWGGRPQCVLSARGRRLALWRPGCGTAHWEGDPFAALRALLAAGGRPGGAPRRRGRPGRRGAGGGGGVGETAVEELPFRGGAVGYFGYGLRTLLEELPARRRDDLGFPDLWFAFYDAFWARDHVTGRTWQVGAPASAAPVGGPRPAPVAPTRGRAAGRERARSNFTRAEYCRAVERVQEYIAAGDVYQVNLSQRFRARAPADALRLFARLRELNPAPFSALLGVGGGGGAGGGGGRALLSASPERYLRVSGRQVETRPIKGTRPRGLDAAADARLARELVRSAKDNAELAMIVDLERNDLGRVCEIGSVRVAEARVLEAFPTVFHLVATVTGELRAGLDALDLVRASFPGGSITGVPKLRAMEIIDELEPTARGPYTGAIGWLGYDGSADLSIAIRILALAAGEAFFQVGGAITADSEAAAEYAETLAKAEGMKRVLGIEWGGGGPRGKWVMERGRVGPPATGADRV